MRHQKEPHLNACFQPPGIFPIFPLPDSQPTNVSADALARATSLPSTGRSGRGDVQEDAQSMSRAYGATTYIAFPPSGSVEGSRAAVFMSGQVMVMLLRVTFGKTLLSVNSL